jgi:hypothetical protein
MFLAIPRADWVGWGGVVLRPFVFNDILGSSGENTIFQATGTTASLLRSNRSGGLVRESGY